MIGLAPSVPRHPAAVFAAFSGMLFLTVWAVSVQAYSGHASVLPIIFFAVISLVALTGLIRHFGSATLGACNVVTLVRAAITALLAGAIIVPATTQTAAWALCAAATLTFALDGIDGWLARRTGMASGFGARFDMEVDAALGAVLALILWRWSQAGPAVLVLGAARYVFIVATMIRPRLGAPLPDRFRRKVVCVIQIGVLIVLLMPLTPGSLMIPIAAGAATALVWSFAVDIRWLLARGTGASSGSSP